MIIYVFNNRPIIAYFSMFYTLQQDSNLIHQSTGRASSPEDHRLGRIFSVMFEFVNENKLPLK